MYRTSGLITLCAAVVACAGNPGSRVPSPDDECAAAGARTVDVDAVERRPELRNPAQVVSLIQQLYPPALKEAGTSGQVDVRMRVDACGIPVEPVVLASSGLPEMDRAALQVVRAMRFRPGTLGGEPVTVWVTLPVTFSAR